MSTSILPVKAGAKDLVRIGADKRTTSSSPSPVVGLLMEITGSTTWLKGGRKPERVKRKEVNFVIEGQGRRERKTGMDHE